MIHSIAQNIPKSHSTVTFSSHRSITFDYQDQSSWVPHGSAKEIATVPSVAHLGGVGVVNLAHRIHRSHVSRSDGTGKQCDPPDLWEDIGCSVGLDSPQHLFHLNISQPFAAGMPLVLVT